MNFFQVLSMIVLILAILFVIVKFMTRNRGKKCPECIQSERRKKMVDVKKEPPKPAIVDSDSDSDLSDEENDDDLEVKRPRDSAAGNRPGKGQKAD